MKYEITDIVHPDNPKLKRIRALKDFSYVKKGDLGGWVPYLWRDDGERFTRNEDGTYTMDKNREAQPTCFYRYTYGYLMNTGCFSVYPPNKPKGEANEIRNYRHHPS